ncbi:MAG: alpha/beta hydrolase-fold protein [Cellvibrio sp.]|uniref:alpha/beta hydrolase n=1 Tax=Cellvibrio sp. TaxID=1965322 RepID=UPI00319FDD3D
MYRQLLLVITVLVFGCTSAFAQQTNRQFVIQNTEIIPIHSKHTGRDHELVIVYPASYASNPNKKYPVLYYLDAYWDTPSLVSTYGNLSYDRDIPEFIMVGLSYPSSTNYGKERRIDYTFTAAEENSGKGQLFLDFIQKEVAPLIETKYRGEKTDRVLGGSSLGGLFTISTAYKTPDFFTGYIAISPAAMWDKGALARLDNEYAKQHKALNGRMFISYGTDEYKPFLDPIISLQKQIAARKYTGLELLNYRMEGLDHAGVKSEGYARGLIWVWKAKMPAGPGGLELEIKGRQ